MLLVSLDVLKNREQGRKRLTLLAWIAFLWAFMWLVTGFTLVQTPLLGLKGMRSSVQGHTLPGAPVMGLAYTPHT